MRTSLPIFWIAFLSWVSGFSQDGKSIIRFQSIVVTIERLEAFDQKELDRVFDKEALFSADLGETLESADILIKTEKFKDIEVYQAFETSVTIMDEGPHCDLVNWRHHTSDWERLGEVKPNTFRTMVYPGDELSKFPTVTIREVQDAARKQCGDGWADLIKGSKSVYDYPCDVGVSKYFLKVKGVDKTTGTRVEKKIVILIPMGC